MGISIGGLGIDLLAPPDPTNGVGMDTPAITPGGKNRGNNLHNSLIFGSFLTQMIRFEEIEIRDRIRNYITRERVVHIGTRW